MATGSVLKKVFFEAIELAPAERREFLDELESSDAEFFAELEQLLEAHDRALAASEAAQRSLQDEADAPVGLELPFYMGNYELLEHLAEGGSGIVYRARQVDLERTVAIKVLRAGRLATGEEVRRFRAEAEASARLDHPSIVPVHEVGIHEGRHFICMKLIEGPSLDLCKSNYYDDPRTAATLVARIARALHHGHRRGVLHRDIKPSNILLDEDGTPYVADFGTAKLIDGAGGQTVTGWVLGTPSCMAPEQASASGDVTVATDVYSLGCVLYELLVGRPPVVATGLMETLRRVQEDTPTAVRTLRPEIHGDLETICHTCLAKQPARRYGSALAMAEDLERWLSYEPIKARKPTRLERLGLAWRRNPLVTSLVAAVSLLAVTLVVGTVVAGFELRAGIKDTLAAEESAREQLRNAYLAEARGLRQGQRAGRREEALQLLGLAAEIRPGLDLVNEGVCSLALSDIASVRTLSHSPEEQSILCFDGDLQRYFQGRLNGDNEVRSAVDDSLIASLENNGFPAWRARFDPSGRYLGLVHHARFGAGGERTVIWDLAGPVVLMDVPRLPMGELDFAPDRAALAVCWPDGRLLEVDLETMEERTLVQFDLEKLPRVIRYSPAGESLAVALKPADSVRLYSLTGQLLSELEGHAEIIMNMSWSPEGTRLLAGCSDYRSYVWEVESGELIATLAGHRAEVVRTAFPRRDVAATYSWDGMTRLWDLQTSQTFAITEEILQESPPTSELLGLGTPQHTRVGRVVHGSPLRELHGHENKDPRSLTIDATDTLIASGGETGVILWDLASAERLDDLEVESLLDQLFLPDGSLLVASRERIVRWRITEGRFDGAPELLHEGLGRELTLSPDGRTLAFLDRDFLSLVVLDGSGETRRIPVTDVTDRLAFSADGELIAAGSYRGSGVRVWTTTGGEEVAHLSPEEPDCTPHFSPDGRWLAYGTEREYVVHHVDTWDVLYRVTRGNAGVATAKVTRFSPDSRMLAGTFGRSDIMLMDSRSGEPLVVFRPPGRQIFSRGRFTSDGRHLVVASESNRVLVWDLERVRQELADAGLGAGWNKATPTKDVREESR